MALKLPGLSNRLFDHSEDYNQGLGQVRRGQSTTVVAKDGTGDFDDLQEAIKSLSYGGGKILLKEGVYKATDLKFEDKLTIEGESLDAVIELDNSGSNNKYTDMSGLSDIGIKNVTIKLKGGMYMDSSDTFYHIDISGTSDIRFDKVRFINYSEDESGFDDIAIFTGDSSSRLRLTNCKAKNEENGTLGEIFRDSAMEEFYIEGNEFGGISLTTSTASGEMKNCMVINNRLEGILLGSYEMRENIIIGNTFSDVVMTGVPDNGISSDENIINSNRFTGSNGSVYLGSDANNNVVVGNVINEEVNNTGSNTVANNELY